MANIVFNDNKDCGKPGEPPPVIIYSCIYEYMCIKDCSASSRLTPNPSILTDIQGTVITRSEGIFNQGRITFGPYSIMGTIGTPTTAPYLLGKVTDEEWQNIRNDGTPINHNDDGPGWVYTPHHNSLTKPNRWLLAKFYYEKLHYVFKFDPETGEENPPHECGFFPSDGFMPSPPDKGWWEAQGAECPNYYTLKACTDCNGEKSNLDDVFSESTDELQVLNVFAAGQNFQTIINYGLNSQTNPPIYDCYDLRKETEGFRDDNHIAAITQGIAKGSKGYAQLNIVDLSNGEDIKYRIENDCQECRNPILWIVSDVPNCEGVDCDARTLADVADAGWNPTIQSYVDAQNVIYGSSPKTAQNLTFIKDKLTDKNLDHFFWKGANGRCAKFVKIDAECAHADILAKCLGNSVSDLASYITNANYDNSVCACGKDNGYLGDINSTGIAYKICHPLHGLLTLTTLGNERVDEKDDASFSMRAFAPAAYWSWYLKTASGSVVGPLRDGQTFTTTDSLGNRIVTTVSVTTGGSLLTWNSTLTFSNVGISFDNSEVFVVANNGQGTSKRSNNASFNVDEVPMLIRPKGTIVTAVKVSLWCPKTKLNSSGDRALIGLNNKFWGPEWRWVLGDYSAFKGQYFMCKLMEGMRTRCPGPNLGCQAPGGNGGDIEGPPMNPQCGAGAGTGPYLDGDPTLKYQVVGMIDEVDGPMTWEDCYQRYPALAGITAQSNPHQTNKKEVWITTTYEDPDDVPIQQ